MTIFIQKRPSRLVFTGRGPPGRAHSRRAGIALHHSGAGVLLYRTSTTVPVGSTYFKHARTKLMSALRGHFEKTRRTHQSIDRDQGLRLKFLFVQDGGYNYDRIRRSLLWRRRLLRLRRVLLQWVLPRAVLLVRT